MGIIFKKREAFEDSVYARRLERGEIDGKTLTVFHRPNELERLRQEVKELTAENRRLRKEIVSCQEEISRMTFVNDMDDLIDAMKKDAEKQTKSSADIFGALLKAKPSTSSSTTENMLSPDNYYSDNRPDLPEYEEGEIIIDEADIEGMDWTEEER